MGNIDKPNISEIPPAPDGKYYPHPGFQTVYFDKGSDGKYLLHLGSLTSPHNYNQKEMFNAYADIAKTLGSIYEQCRNDLNQLLVECGVRQVGANIKANNGKFFSFDRTVPIEETVHAINPTDTRPYSISDVSSMANILNQVLGDERAGSINRTARAKLPSSLASN